MAQKKKVLTQLLKESGARLNPLRKSPHRKDRKDKFKRWKADAEAAERFIMENVNITFPEGDLPSMN
jgi:hypothetical protein